MKVKKNYKRKQLIYLKIKEIPIQNIYYMLMYAWDRARDIENINIDKVKGNNF